MKVLERFGGVAILAGVVCYVFALCLLVVGNYMVPSSAEEVVVDIHGNVVPVPQYTAEEAAGRQVYIEQVCWHCHSQFVRPVNEENLRFGPVSQPGESVRDVPHLYSTRRTGPDLSREGWLRHDDWHYAHFYNPRYTVPDSPMPNFDWFFRDAPNSKRIKYLLSVLDSDGDGIVSPKFDDKSHWPQELKDELQKELSAPTIDRRGVDAPLYKQSTSGEELWRDEDGKRPYDAHDAYKTKNQGDGILSDYDAAPVPTKDMKNLVTYLQQLGTAIGKWRKPEVLGTPRRGVTPPMKGVEATYMAWQMEGDAWVEKEATISVPNGQMPQRHKGARRYGFHLTNAPEADRKESENFQRAYDALIKEWRKANPEWDDRLEKGEELYTRHCSTCHGVEGRGNGDGAQFMIVRPRDFTKAKYRYRSTPSGNMPLDGDLYRSLYTGLWGTTMPSWKQLPSEHLWLLVDYVKSFRESEGDWSPGKAWNDESKANVVPPTPKVDPEEYDAIIARGRAVYLAMSCNSCHGAEGRGDGPGWNDTGRDNGGQIRPRHLPPLSDKDIPALRYRGGAAPQDLYRTIFNGLDGVGMPVPAFANGWKNGDAYLAAQKSGGDVEAAKKQARIKLNVPLKDQALIDAGIVEVGTDALGNYAEFIPYLKRSVKGRRGWKVGDDWALVMFVRHLSGIEWESWRD